jgi:peptide/nickel transport system substrate-binding protein
MDTRFYRRKKSRWVFLPGLILLAALILQACAPAATATSAPPTSAPAATQAPAATEAPQVTQPEAATEVPTEASGEMMGGTLRVAMQPIVQIDPAFISSDAEVLVANHVYDYLVDVDPQNQIVPRLAKDWTMSDDGLTYTFMLEEGVTFHDGNPLSAADVVWTFDRLRDPAADLPTSGLYENITGIEATGDLEVTFTLAAPNPFFLYDLSDNHALILKAGTDNADTVFNGTGPFKVVNYIPEDRVVMEANPDYFVEGEPHLSGLEIIFFNDETASVDALRSGQVDLVMRMSIDLYQSLENEANITRVDIPTNGFDLVRLRSDRAPGNDPNVIQAFKLATDREAIFQLVQQSYGGLGYDTPIGPLYTQYFNPEFAPPPRDVEAARQLLTDAGYPDGLEMTLHVPDTGGRPDLAVVLQNQWAEAGINVDVSVEPESVYYGDNGWLEVDLGITGWGSRPYPQFYLNVMLTCDAIWNESHYCNETFDELVNTAGTTLDEAERVDAYNQIQQILAEEGPIIIPYFFAQVAAINNQFDNFALKAFAGRTDFRQVTYTP